jgi:hypothetical protein
MNGVERARDEASCVFIDNRAKAVTVEKPGEEKKVFTFDFVYDDNSRQVDVFTEAAQPIIESVLQGYNGTIFAYGQTGTGKTWTMEGIPSSEDQKGINTRSFEQIFKGVDSAASNVQYVHYTRNDLAPLHLYPRYLVRASYLEIYLNEIYDLLSKTKREKKELREDQTSGVFVKDLTFVAVKSVDDVMKILQIGSSSRQVGATLMNPGSSRSHSILNLQLEMCETDPEGKIEPRSCLYWPLPCCGRGRVSSVRSRTQRV